MHRVPSKFANPMDEESIRKRLSVHNDIYKFAVQCAGSQSMFTVDKLSWKLKDHLPKLVADLAAEVEYENEVRGY